MGASSVSAAGISEYKARMEGVKKARESSNGDANSGDCVLLSFPPEVLAKILEYTSGAEKERLYLFCVCKMFEQIMLKHVCPCKDEGLEWAVRNGYEKYFLTWCPPEWSPSSELLRDIVDMGDRKGITILLDQEGTRSVKMLNHLLSDMHPNLELAFILAHPLLIRILCSSPWTVTSV